MRGGTATLGRIRPDLAALAAVATAFERQLDIGGWSQPLMLLALEGSDLRPLIVGGDPFEVLFGWDAPPEADALVLACEGWAFPPELVEPALAEPHRYGLPTDHPRRQELRLVAAVAREGEEVLVQRRRGDRAVVDRHPGAHPRDDGGVLSALRRAYGLATRATAHPVSAFLTRAWLVAVVDGAERGPMDEGAADALRPDLTLAATTTWEDVRTVARRGGFAVVRPEVAEWMDADMLAEYLVSVLATPADLLATIRALAGDPLADHLSAVLDGSE